MNKKRGKTEKRICLYCQQEFDALLIKIRQGKALFCGLECYKKHRKANSKDPKQRAVIHQKKHKYGLTEEEYLSLFEKQHNKCAICNCDLLSTKACVDHNHTTLKIRGLLCDRCNRGIGFLKDDITILENAVNYLKQNS